MNDERNIRVPKCKIQYQNHSSTCQVKYLRKKTTTLKQRAKKRKKNEIVNLDRKSHGHKIARTNKSNCDRKPNSYSIYLRSKKEAGPMEPR